MNDRDCINCIRNVPGTGCTSWDCKYINRTDAIRLWEAYTSPEGVTFTVNSVIVEDWRQTNERP